MSTIHTTNGKQHHYNKTLNNPLADEPPPSHAHNGDDDSPVASKLRSDTTATSSSSSTTSSSTAGPVPGPRKIFIQKSETGFGFNVRGQVSEGGPLKLYNGEFYAPLQQVSAVLAGGAAEKAGLFRGDRILEVNGVNVDGATHKQVVDLIKSGGDYLTLTVIALPSDEITRMHTSLDNLNASAHSDDSSCNSNDYTTTTPATNGSTPTARVNTQLTVPDFAELTQAHSGDKYVVFNIYMGGAPLCSRRYKEFSVLHSLLKREFPDFNFPSFPSKWPFKMSEQQLEQRRRGLENYLDKISSVKVIYETQIVKDFLLLSGNQPSSLIGNIFSSSEVRRDNLE